jgi:hypothetical protein
MKNRLKTLRQMRLIYSFLFTVTLYGVAVGQASDEFNFESESASLRYINFGCLTAAKGSQGESFGFKFINGVLINNSLAIGIGFGYDKYSEKRLIPLFLDLKLFPDFSANGAYFFADIGNSLKTTEAFESFDEEGFYFNGGGGMVLFRHNTHGMTLDFGYKVQRAQGRWSNTYYYGNERSFKSGSDSKNRGFLSMSIGITI